MLVMRSVKLQGSGISIASAAYLQSTYTINLFGRSKTILIPNMSSIQSQTVVIIDLISVS